jgi:hypothetical protein
MKSKLSNISVGYMFALLCLVFFQSCTYYKPIQKSATEVAAGKFRALAGKEIIVHSKQGIYLLENFSFDSTINQISGTLGKVPPQHLKYINENNNKYRYKKKEDIVLKEVHLFSDIGVDTLVGSDIKINPDKIDQLIFIQKDKAKNTMTAIGLGVAGSMLIILVFLLINPPFTGL